MILIKPDHDRRIEIPGVSAPVRRPVDIDRSVTGFSNLRTLRIYRFDRGAVIEGHAEEDEVLLVVMEGAIDLNIVVDPLDDLSRPMTLSAPSDQESVTCAAYLPPHAAYKLIARSDAEVAYARATPVGAGLPKAFSSLALSRGAGNTVLMEELDYAGRLRWRLVHLDAQQSEIAFSPIHESEVRWESLVYLATRPSTANRVATLTGENAKQMALNSSDTIAVMPGERPTLNIARGASGLALIVMAT